MPITLPYKLQVFLSDDTRDRLKRAAKYHRLSLQELVETWLEMALDTDEAARDTPTTPRPRRHREPVGA